MYLVGIQAEPKKIGQSKSQLDLRKDSTYFQNSTLGVL